MCVVPYWAVWPYETMLLPKRHVIVLYYIILYHYCIIVVFRIALWLRMSTGCVWSPTGLFGRMRPCCCQRDMCLGSKNSQGRREIVSYLELLFHNSFIYLKLLFIAFITVIILFQVYIGECMCNLDRHIYMLCMGILSW